MASENATLVIGYWNIRGLAAPLRRALHLRTPMPVPSHLRSTCSLL